MESLSDLIQQREAIEAKIRQVRLGMPSGMSCQKTKLVMRT